MNVKKLLAVTALSTSMIGTMIFNSYAGELTWIRTYVTTNYPEYTVESYEYNEANQTVKVYMTKDGNTIIKFFKCDVVDGGKCYVD